MIERGSPGRKLFGLFSYIPKLRLNCSQVLWYNLNTKIKQQIGICKGGLTMKKIGLGIAILLFAIILSLCSSGMGLLVIGIGIVGLIFSIIGFMERK